MSPVTLPSTVGAGAPLRGGSYIRGRVALRRIQVYPKGGLEGSVPAGREQELAEAWSGSMTDAWIGTIRDRVVKLTQKPGVTLVSTHVAPDAKGDVTGPGLVTLRYPKIVITLYVPDSTSHASVMSWFAAYGFDAWLKARTRLKVPADVTILSWVMSLRTGLGRGLTEEPE